MSSFLQVEANRRNAQRSTGPVTEAGKKRSRRNAVRHGLTAETVIDALEDAEDYAAFEMAVTADNDAQTAVERELVLRLASVLWRLRRATAIESGLFRIQARHLLQFRQARRAHQQRQDVIDHLYRNVAVADPGEPVATTTDHDQHVDAQSSQDDVGRLDTLRGRTFGWQTFRPALLIASADTRQRSGVRLATSAHVGVPEPPSSNDRYSISWRMTSISRGHQQ